MQKNESGSVSILGLLLLMFIGLKITNNITWSWWWVMAPVWMPVALIFGFWLSLCIFIFLAELFNKMRYGK